MCPPSRPDFFLWQKSDINLNQERIIYPGMWVTRSFPCHTKPYSIWFWCLKPSRKNACRMCDVILDIKQTKKSVCVIVLKWLSQNKSFLTDTNQYKTNWNDELAIYINNYCQYMINQQNILLSIEVASKLFWINVPKRIARHTWGVTVCLWSQEQKQSTWVDFFMWQSTNCKYQAVWQIICASLHVDCSTKINV